jgi:hypothetical protein
LHGQGCFLHHDDKRAYDCKDEQQQQNNMNGIKGHKKAKF